MSDSDSSGHPDPHLLAGQVKKLAHQLGFDLAGIARADASERAEFFRAWIAEGRAGEMSYLERRLEERLDPARYLPGARSAVCVAMNYHVPLTPIGPERTSSTPAPTGRVARYALGSDYHEII
ncbi:MAG: DUF1730 domain-containing protein, partial [Phycisphaerae bacterium]|nr:DUF1730 domain-containing protein [Phycisphaerae bacterium]